MKIETIAVKNGNVNIPTIKITSSDNSPNVIIIHGYGGNKEEQLGLSWRIADLGYNTFTIDLRGHGENALPLSLGIQEDVEYLTNSNKKPSQPIITIGHSLGGRLALLSKANYRIGLSPALNSSYSERTVSYIKNMRQYRVIEETPNINFDIAAQLPSIESTLLDQDLIVYGSRDVPEIVQYCETLSKRNKNIIRIENGLHNDIFLLEQTFSAIKNHLQKIEQHHLD